VGFKAYAIMCPRYIQVSFTFAETCWIFQYTFLQSCLCLRIPVLWHLVKLHRYY
jgi:hypothetical protein